MIKKLTNKKKLTLKSIVSKPRREAFMSEDRAFLASKPDIRLGKQLGGGQYGGFHTIEGNERLGVKLPYCHLAESNDGDCSYCTNKGGIIEEGKRCHKQRFNSKPMLAPTKMVQVQRYGKKCIGLVRPLVGNAAGANSRQLTDNQLKMIHSKLIELSESGIALYDGIQCGFTASGRVLQFDLGDAEETDEEHAFEINRENWISFLAMAKGISSEAFEEIGGMNDEPFSVIIANAKRGKSPYIYNELTELQKVVKKYGDIRM
jgi:hypothetical protein